MSNRRIGGLVEKAFPNWVPEKAITYLTHTEAGQSIRAVAREQGFHASTVMRQVRGIERRRDDLLVDEALRRLSESHRAYFHSDRSLKDAAPMSITTSITASPVDETTIEQEARRALRWLAEPGACLAVARDMEKAVVARETADGQTVRTAVVDRPVAEAMALKDWISCASQGRLMRYTITGTGRTALREMLAREADPDASSCAGARDISGEAGASGTGEGGGRKRIRYSLAESPLIALARRRDKAGKPFLSDDLVAAGERLREDFELAQMGPKVTQDWDRFLTAGAVASLPDAPAGGQGASAARDRVAAALADLGPGLGDVVLRCCCYLEGMEAAERRMG